MGRHRQEAPTNRLGSGCIAAGLKRASAFVVVGVLISGFCESAGAGVLDGMSSPPRPVHSRLPVSPSTTAADSALFLPDCERAESTRVAPTASGGTPSTPSNDLCEISASAQAGDPAAAAALARAYETGDGVPVDRAAAQDWKTRAANAGHLPSLLALVRARKKDEATLTAVMKWLDLALEQGSVEAMIAYGDLFLEYSEHPELEQAAAESYLRQAAAFGEARAQYMLWELLTYYTDEDDEVEAIGWLRRAASLGHTQAAVWLGYSLTGAGLPRDYAAAAKWYAKAAEKSDDAAYRLAKLVRLGHVPRDAAREAALIERAYSYVDRGEYAYDLATAYLWGAGVPKSAPTARALFCDDPAYPFVPLAGRWDLCQPDKLSPAMASSLPTQVHSSVETLAHRFGEGFNGEPCSFELLPGRGALCGRMTVPEDYSAPDGRKVSFPVVMFRPAEVTQRHPIVLLGGGGPGVSIGLGAGVINTWWGTFEQTFLSRGYELLLVDVRGVGSSEPNLSCPEIAAAAPAILSKVHSHRAELDAWREVTLRCFERLRSTGIDLAQYHSLTSAKDVESLRQALGYDQWTLFGISYGAQIAIASMKAFPKSARSVILDSPSLPNVNDATLPDIYQAAFDRLFAACDTDARCAARFPNLGMRLANVLTQLDNQPLSLRVSHPTTLAPIRITVNGRRLVEILHTALYSPWTMRRIPITIEALLQGSDDLLVEMARAWFSQVADPDYADGVNWATLCRERLMFTDDAVMEARWSGLTMLRRFSYVPPDIRDALCAATGVAPVQFTPSARSIPTLVLNGYYDPITPRNDVALKALEIRPLHAFLVPDASHSVSTSSYCADPVIGEFLGAPEAAITTRCDAAGYGFVTSLLDF